MASAEVFKEFYSKLVETLPMDDSKFIAKLFSNNLPGDLKSQLKCEKTSADKTTLFLDSSSFDKLLNVMEDSEYEHVKELAKLIRTSLRKRSNSDNG